MAFLITGQMKVKTLQANFKEEFGLTLRLYDGKSFADDSKTIAKIRSKEGSGDLSVKRNMKVGNFEDKLKEEFGIKSQVAGSGNGYLCDDNLTLAKALEVDAKKVAKEAAPDYTTETLLNHDPAEQKQNYIVFACETMVRDIENKASVEYDEDGEILDNDQVFDAVVTYVDMCIYTHKNLLNRGGVFLKAYLLLNKNDSKLIDLTDADESDIRKALEQKTYEFESEDEQSILLIFETTSSSDSVDLQSDFRTVSEEYVFINYCFYHEEVGEYITQTFEEGELESGYLFCDDEYLDDYIVDTDDEQWGPVITHMIKLRS